MEACGDLLLDSNEFYQSLSELGYELSTSVRDYWVWDTMESEDIVKKQLGYLFGINIGSGFDVVGCFRQAVHYYKEGIKPVRHR